MARSLALLLAVCAVTSGCAGSPESRSASAAIQEESRQREALLVERFELGMRNGYSGAVLMPLPIRAAGSVLSVSSPDKQGLQLEIVSVEPLHGCPASGAAEPAGVILDIANPFWNGGMARWKVGCGKPPENFFMAHFADKGGWVRPAPLPVEDAPWRRGSQVPAGVPTVTFLSPAKAVFRLRWEMADKSITEWETVSLVAGSFNDFLVLSPLKAAQTPAK